MLSGIHCLHAESGGRRLCEYPASASRHSAVTDFDMLSFVVFYFVFVLCMGFVERQGPFFYGAKFASYLLFAYFCARLCVSKLITINLDKKDS